jgi:hypothetical protein
MTVGQYIFIRHQKLGTKDHPVFALPGRGATDRESIELWAKAIGERATYHKEDYMDDVLSSADHD